MTPRPYGVVAHEAAHVVVGVALGLRLRSAVVREWYERGEPRYGWTWFDKSTRVEDALVLAGGIAWSLATRDGLESADADALRKLTTSTYDYAAYVTAAGAIIESRSTAHARVVRALIEHDLTSSDITKIARGVPPTRLREDEI